jgi:hypothetical protein
MAAAAQAVSGGEHPSRRDHDPRAERPAPAQADDGRTQLARDALEVLLQLIYCTHLFLLLSAALA